LTTYLIGVGGKAVGGGGVFDADVGVDIVGNLRQPLGKGALCEQQRKYDERQHVHFLHLFTLLE
jgi:hypothetical protein